MLRRFILLLLGLVWVLGLSGQVPNQGLSFGSAAQLLCSSNQQLRSAEYALKSAQSKVASERGLYSPQIEIAGGYSLFDRDMKVDFRLPLSSSMLDVGLTLQERYMGGVGAYATLPLWMGGRIRRAVEVAKLEEQNSELKLRQLSGLLVVQLVQRYFSVVLSESLLLLRQEALRNMNNHLRNVVQMELSGVVPRADRLYVEARVADAERDVELSQLQLKTARRVLESLIGTNVGELSSPLTDVCFDQTLESLFDKMQLQSPLLQEVELGEQMAWQGVRASRSELLPEVVAMGGAVIYSHNMTPILPRWAVGVGLRWRIFDGLRSVNNLKVAKYRLCEVESLSKDVHSSVRLLVESCYNDFMAAKSRVLSCSATIAYLDEWVRMRRLSFEEGIATSVELVDAELMLSAARVERLNSLYELNLKLARLLEAVGESERYFDFVD